MTLKSTRGRNRVLSVLTAFLLCLEIIPVQAEEVTYAWNEVTRVRMLRRQIPTAISAYTDGTDPDAVTHEEGMIDEIMYDIIRVTPSEHAFIQVDYSEYPTSLNNLKDWGNIENGFLYAGGINGGYFSNTEYEYGKPVGAVRNHNAWTWWNGIENTPAYGSGYATCYWTGDDMWMRYHGWAWNDWQGDDSWRWWTGYTINAENGISGSYTYFVNGEEVDITGGSAGMFNYRNYGRAVTILAQNKDKQYLLITIFGTLGENRIREMLRELNTLNAIRLDGGGSTQMVYETDVVKQVRPELRWSEVPKDVAAETERALGVVEIESYKIDIYSGPSYSYQTRGDATHMERYQVYEMAYADGVSWYRIGTKRWIPVDSSNSSYEAIEYPVRIKMRNTLSVYSVPTISLDIVGTAKKGEVYTVYETKQMGQYEWHRIGDKEWIATTPDDIEVALENEHLYR